MQKLGISSEIHSINYAELGSFLIMLTLLLMLTEN